MKRMGIGEIGVMTAVQKKPRRTEWLGEVDGERCRWSQVNWVVCGGEGDTVESGEDGGRGLGIGEGVIRAAEFRVISPGSSFCVDRLLSQVMENHGSVV